MTEEDEAFEELAMRQGSWQHTSGWRKKQIQQELSIKVGGPFHVVCQCDKCKALADHAMRETQRLGQEIEQEPAFFTHSVERPYDWSEWVCPDPKSYLFKCCDCGLVHEAEFGVVRYKSETEREDCDRVDDPNLHAVFRMRRSEQWSPEDTAHRTGGLPMAQPEQEQKIGCVNHDCDQCKAQPEQEPVALQMDVIVVNLVREGINKHRARELAEHFIKHTTPPQRTWVGLTDEEIKALASWWPSYDQMPALMVLAKDIQNSLKEKNT